MKKTLLNSLLLFLLALPAGAQKKNELGVCFSDLIRFPGMNYYFNDEVWISGENQFYANRTYSRFASGLFFERQLKNDWSLTFKSCFGFRNLHESVVFSSSEILSDGSIQDYGLVFDGSYVQQSVNLIPGLYYTIANDSRISGKGGIELLYLHTGRGKQNYTQTITNSTTSLDSSDTLTHTSQQTINRGTTTGSYDIASGNTFGIGFVAGLKIRITKKLYAGLDISEYFAYSAFTKPSLASIESNSTTTNYSGGILTSSSSAQTKENFEAGSSLHQFSFSNVVALLYLSYSF